MSRTLARTCGTAFTALALAVTLPLALAGAAGAADGTWERTWGRDVIQPTAPTNTGTGPEICIVAVDCQTGASSGVLGGEFGGPRGVAVDAAGNVYVAEAQTLRIDKFDSSGNFMRAWGFDVVSAGPGNTGTGFEICVAANGDTCKPGTGFDNGDGGEISAAQDVAVDSAGKVYVAEGQRIQKFDSNGTWERAWGRDVIDGGGTGAEICTVAANCKLGDLNGELGGEFRAPNGVGVDAAGGVYVADEVRQRIQKFDSSGNFVRAWGEDVVSSGPGNTGTGFEICVAANGDTCQQGGTGGLGGEFNNPRSVDADAAGGVYVADITNQRIHKFDTSGNFERAWGNNVVQEDQTGDVDPDGFEVCTSAADCQQGASTGALGGEFNNPINVEAVASGVYVTDQDNQRLQKFSSTGTWQRAWGLDAVQEDQPGDVDPDGFEVCTLAAACKSAGPANGLGGDLAQPYGLGADDSGNVYATSPGAFRVSKFVESTPPAPPPTPPGTPPGAEVTSRPGATSAQAELPKPEVGKNVNVNVVRGVVRIRQPGEGSFRTLAGEDQIRMGSLIDTTKGRVRLTSAAGRGKTQTADFYDGLFKVTQRRGRRPITDLRLAGKLVGCSSKKASTAAKKRKGRRLWGKGKGRFRTRGRRSSALVRGTTWLVEDRCDSSTLTRVRQGVVRVRDFARKRNVTVRAGGSYVARPR